MCMHAAYSKYLMFRSEIIITDVLLLMLLSSLFSRDRRKAKKKKKNSPCAVGMLICTQKRAPYRVFDMQKTYLRLCLRPWHSYCCDDGAPQSKQIMFSYVVPQGVIPKSACIAHWAVRSPFSQRDGCASCSKVMRVIIWWSTIHCAAYI